MEVKQTEPFPKTRCSVCGMGWVVPVRLKSANQVIYVCDESEETWLDLKDVVSDSFAEIPTHGHYSYLSFAMESVGLHSTEYEQLEWLETEA